MHTRPLSNIIMAVLFLSCIACFAGALINWRLFNSSMGKSPFVRITLEDRDRLKSLNSDGKRYFVYFIRFMLAAIVCFGICFIVQRWCPY
jgi:hypothetical protein